jgi:two-component system nitrate/nitrite response regulator NarL
MARDGRKTNGKPLCVVIADGVTLFRTGLRSLLNNSGGDVVVIGEAADGDEAIRQVLELKPDILILDLILPKLDGLEVLRRVRHIENMRKVILTDQITQEDSAKALQLGVGGVILKESRFDELIKCIRRIGAGGTWVGQTASKRAKTSSARKSRDQKGFHITNREMEIINTVAAGRTNEEIARQLSIRVGTVKYHLTNIFNKTGASTRLELVTFLVEKGLLDESKFRVGNGPNLGLGRAKRA